MVKDPLGEDLQADNLGRDGFIGDVNVQLLHLGDGLLTLGEHLVQFCIACGLGLFGHFLHHIAAEAPRHHTDHCCGSDGQQEMGQAIQREQQAVQQPRNCHGVQGDGGLSHDLFHVKHRPFLPLLYCGYYKPSAYSGQEKRGGHPTS